MLRGNNSLRLNPATMNLIVQEWVDREFKKPVKVTGVSWNSAMCAFDVSTSEKSAEDEAK